MSFVPTIEDDYYEAHKEEGFCITCKLFVLTPVAIGDELVCSFCEQTTLLNAVTAYEQGEFHLVSDNMGEDDDDETENEEEDDEENADDLGDEEEDDEDLGDDGVEEDEDSEN